MAETELTGDDKGSGQNNNTGNYGPARGRDYVSQLRLTVIIW